MDFAFRFIAGAVLACQCAGAVSAPAQSASLTTPAPLPVIRMLHTSWTAAAGAPTGITGIGQTADGWLWIGSTSGLFRFDGVRFERARAALAPLSSNIARMGVLPGGALWIGYRYGGASLLKDGTMRHFRAGERNAPSGTPSGLAFDGQGRLWFGSSSSSLRYLGPDGAWRQPEAELGAPAGPVESMLLDRRGIFWVRTAQAVFALPKGAARFERRRDMPGSGELAEHPDGSIWSSDNVGRGLHLVDGAARPLPDVWRENAIISFTFDREGAFWHGAYRGVIYTPYAGAPRQSMEPAHGLSGGPASAVFEDREGNVWAGTSNGIDRFRPYRLRAIPLPNYFGGARPLAARPGGGVWADRSFLADAQAAPVAYAPEGTMTSTATALHATRDGTLWTGGPGGLWRVRNGQREAVPLPPGRPDLARRPVYSMASGADGALWVSWGRAGLYSLRDGAWRAHGGVPELGAYAATVMATGADGRMWLGSTGNQLALLEQGKVRRFGREQGLQIGTVLAVLPAGAGAWIGGENGLAWFDGQRFIPVAGRGGDPFAGVTGLVFAADGSLWLNGGAGLSAIAAAELRRAIGQPGYRVRAERLDYRDGLPGTASGITPLPSAIRSADGKLWFSVSGGVVAFDPAALPRNRLAPPVQITGIRGDGREYPARDGVQLEPHTGTLEIDFTALSYRSPERVRFRYRLEGVDPDWQEPERRRSAYYTNLAPGHYRFRVMAANDDGVWNETGATLSFEQAPSLTQMAWFRILGAAALAGGLWLLHRMRLRNTARRVRMQMTERLAERERIARELHDTVLQSVQGLLLKIGAAVHGLRGEDRAMFEDALETAREVLGEGRDRVAGLRGDALAAAGLVQAIRDFGADLARESVVRFDVVSNGEELALAGALADEVLAIAREAIWNAFVHARPRVVSVTLDWSPDQLRLTIADDGAGIPGEVLRSGGRSGHWGLPGMRERAARIGTLDLVSGEGKGTAWILRIPLQAAAKANSVQTLNPA